MSRPDPLIKARAVESTSEFVMRHTLNPNSEVHLRALGAKVGLERLGVALGRVPPGRESFVYHAHLRQEEWIYILSGRGIAEIDDRELEVGPGALVPFAPRSD